MQWQFETRHILAIGMGMIGIAADFMVFRDTIIFVPLLAVCLAIAASQHIADYFGEAKRQREVELKFPDFVRNLVAAIKSGMLLFEKGRETVEEIGEVVEDLIAEAQAEIEEETEHSVIEEATETVSEVAEAAVEE